MKDKVLESLRNFFKQLDFLVILVVYLALTDLREWSFLRSIVVMLGCICLSSAINLLLARVSNVPKAGKLFYTSCEHCGKLSTAHRLLGTLYNSLAKPHFFLILIMYFLVRGLDGGTFTAQITLFSAIMIATFLGIILVDTLWTVLFKKSAVSKSP